MTSATRQTNYNKNTCHTLTGENATCMERPQVDMKASCQRENFSTKLAILGNKSQQGEPINGV
jgi:hypothetical protein